MSECAENGQQAEPEEVPAFREYSLESLKVATNGFNTDFIVSESGEKAPNCVYKGRLEQNRWIAVKRFPKAAWPDPKGFAVCKSLTMSILICSLSLASVALLGMSHLV